MNSLKYYFRQIKKFPNWLYYFPAALMWLVFHLFYRVKIEDPCGHLLRTRQAVVTAWHNRLMFFAVIFPRRRRHTTVAVVSPSRDGQYVSDFISVFGIGSLRGSSSRRGANALRGGVKAVQDGYCVVFTPDGPRGPRYRMKNGPVMLASLTGIPLVPLSINASRCWRLGGWDGFQIPKPFSRLTLAVGRGFTVPPDLDAGQLEQYRIRAEEELMAVTVDPPENKNGD